MQMSQMDKQPSRNTAVIKMKKSQQPHLSAVLSAIPYTAQILDLVEKFKSMDMPVVAHHLEAAYQEISRIWEEDDFVS